MKSVTKSLWPTRSRKCASIYEQLGLGQFEAVRPAIEQYFAEQKDYKTNRYQMPPELHAEITRRWSKYIEQYGYATEAAGTNG